MCRAGRQPLLTNTPFATALCTISKHLRKCVIEDITFRPHPVELAYVRNRNDTLIGCQFIERRRFPERAFNCWRSRADAWLHTGNGRLARRFGFSAMHQDALPNQNVLPIENCSNSTAQRKIVTRQRNLPPRRLEEA